jgi:hypothetical protein
MRINTFVGSLIGAFAIYGVVAACSSGSGLGLLADAGLVDGSHDGSGDGPVPEAEAAPADCTQWEIQVIEVAVLSPYNTGAWEPISANVVNSSTGLTEIAMRRCVP